MTGHRGENDEHDHHDDDQHDLGFAYDRQFLVPAPSALPALTRRRALGLFAAGGAGVTGAALLARAAPAAAATATAATAATSPTPSETAGPYPADGSNGPDVLDDSGVVRRDIRTPFAGASGGTAQGVPLVVSLRLLDASSGAPLAGAAVYAWHANRVGAYSLYSRGYTGTNYLRGIQVAGAKGYLSFRSIWPACYDGRWPHVHFEVFRSLSAARKGTGRLLTSQIALPKKQCELVYARTSLYPGSRANLARTSLATDMVFRDGWSKELATVTGTTSAGFTAKLRVYV